MDARHDAPSPEDLAAEVGSLTAGLGILTMTFFPFALPALLLALPLVLPLIPVLLLAGVGFLLYRLLTLPVKLARTVRERRAERTHVGYVQAAHR